PLVPSFDRAGGETLRWVVAGLPPPIMVKETGACRLPGRNPGRRDRPERPLAYSHEFDLSPISPVCQPQREAPDPQSAADDRWHLANLRRHYSRVVVPGIWRPFA